MIVLYVVVVFYGVIVVDGYVFVYFSVVKVVVLVIYILVGTVVVFVRVILYVVVVLVVMIVVHVTTTQATQAMSLKLTRLQFRMVHNIGTNILQVW